jgi:hypothetical protein
MAAAAALGPAAARFAAGESRLTRVGADTGAWPPASLVVPLQRWLSTAPLAAAVAALPNMALVAALHARRGPTSGPECDSAAEAALSALLSAAGEAPLAAAAPALRRALVHLRAGGADAAAAGEGVCPDALRRLLVSAAGAQGAPRHAPLLREAAALLAAHVSTCGASSPGAARSAFATDTLCALLSAPGAALLLRGCPEALQKLALVAWTERHTAQDMPLPPLLARLCGALASSASPPLHDADVARVLAPLERLADTPEPRGAALLAALRAALAPATQEVESQPSGTVCLVPEGDEAWRPGFEALAAPADAYLLRVLYSPHATSAAAPGASPPAVASPSRGDDAAHQAAARRLAQRARPGAEAAALRLAMAADGCGAAVPDTPPAALAAAGACLRGLLAAATAAADEPTEADDDAWAMEAVTLVDAATRFGSCMPDAHDPSDAAASGFDEDDDVDAALDGDDSDASAPRAAALLHFAAASSPAAAALLSLAGASADSAAAAPALPPAAASRARRRAAMLRALLCRALGGAARCAERALTSALVEAAALLPPRDDDDVDASGLSAAACAAACAAAPRHWPALVAQAARPVAAVAALRALADRAAASDGAKDAAAHAQAGLTCAKGISLDAADELLAAFASAHPSEAWDVYFGRGPEGARMLTWLMLAQQARLAADAALMRADVGARVARTQPLLQAAARVARGPWRPAARAAAEALHRGVAMATADAAWAAAVLQRELKATKRSDEASDAQRPAKRARTLAAWSGENADAVLEAQTAPMTELLGAAADNEDAAAAALARAIARGASAAARGAALHVAARLLHGGAAGGAQRLLAALDEAAAAGPSRPTAEARAARDMCARAAADCDDCALLA